ncbi:hypothetical protein WSM22_09630 [Cytophagales bacterium WSM2-2]|nr:hypothetical protein WSM22_09630 [Cytophagales bacterium WSM2-2]
MSTTIGFSKVSEDSLAISRLNTKAYRSYLSNPDSAIILANRAIILSENGGYKFQAAYGYYILSKANWAKANYLLSIHYGFESLKIYENTNHIFHWGESNLALARTFLDIKNFPQAKSYMDQALTLAKRNNDSRLLAEVYREKSILLLELKQYDSALWLSNQAIVQYEQRKDTLEASILYGRNARIFYELKDHKKSMAFVKKALLMDSLSGNRRALGISYFMLGQIYYSTNKKDSALIALKKSVPISKSIRNLSTMIKTHQLIARIYEERNQMKDANNQLKLVSQYKDSLYDMEEHGQIQEILSKYELKQKEKTIQSLEVENKLEKQRSRNTQLAVVFISVVAFLLATLSIVFWRMRQWQVKEAKTLQEVNRLKSKLFSVISHDLRGPIANLQSLLDLVTKEFITPAEFKDISLKLKSRLNVSQSTLENLLNWSLSQMEGIRTQKTIFNIAPVITEVMKLSDETASRKQITIDIHTEGDLHVNADVNQVNLILRNLLHNAIKFSSQNSRVAVKVSRSNRHCRVSVIDNGLGMTANEISTVLESNEYFTKSGTEQEKGTGLGFLLCKDFIKRNGGEVYIESEEGKGTSVSFTLPMANQ